MNFSSFCISKGEKNEEIWNYNWLRIKNVFVHLFYYIWYGFGLPKEFTDYIQLHALLFWNFGSYLGISQGYPAELCLCLRTI